MISLGFSNPNQEFGTFITNKIESLSPTSSLDGLNDKLVFVNGAEPTKALCDWETVVLDEEFNPWGDILLNKLFEGRQPGHQDDDIAVDPDQVQVVWLKFVLQSPLGYCQGISGSGFRVTGCCPGGTGGSCALCGDPACKFPNFNTAGEVPKLKTILQILRQGVPPNIPPPFPNIKQVFMSSRTFGGRSNEVDMLTEVVPVPCGAGSPEPWAFENGFTVQQVVTEQVFDGTMPFGGTGTFPWIAWGPYIWAPGTNGSGSPLLDYENLAGLSRLKWDCFHSCADGQHPSRDADLIGLPGLPSGARSGQGEVAERLYAFFKFDPVPKEWFLERPLIRSSTPPSGFVDRLQDRDAATGLIPQGIAEVTVRFDKPVRNLNNSTPPAPSSFVVTSTSTTGLPTVSTVQDLGNNEFKLTLSGPIPPGHWTTIRANLEDSNDNPMRSDPWDRIDLGFLPGGRQCQRHDQRPGPRFHRRKPAESAESVSDPAGPEPQWDV